MRKAALTKNRRKTFHSIRKTLGSNYYRKDLIEVQEVLKVMILLFMFLQCAVRRASAVWASQRPRNKKMLHKRGGKK